ncbi:MAG: hypothetical protein IT490_09255 [Candidatus Contendobacter sp.]|nr:hypothetical protein [Candidatus Contendobacter sp.]
MSLRTELNSELLTESGLSLLAEQETEDSGGEPVSGLIHCKAKATLTLVAKAALSHVKVFTAVPIRAKATLRLSGKALLKAIKALKAKAALRLLARHGTAQAPSGCGMQMTILTDPARPDLILDQYLLVWFNGHPNQCQVTLKLDQGAAFQPAFLWQNPGVTSPAILKIDSAEIPGDGLNHRITATIRQAIGTRTSPAGSISQISKTPSMRTTLKPEWCGATLIRQGEDDQPDAHSHELVSVSDLTRIDWRHSGAVQIIARVPVDYTATRTILSDKAIGYADHNETTFYAEDIGLKCAFAGHQLHNVLFGVAAIQNGSFGPVTWANAPVKIRDRYARKPTPMAGPDQIAGTVEHWSLDGLKKRIQQALFEQNGWNYPGDYSYGAVPIEITRLNIIDTAITKALLRIKGQIRFGGSVTLDDLGRFEARWNPDRTTRSVGFVASTGFVIGTRLGRVLTDAQAKVLNP